MEIELLEKIATTLYNSANSIERQAAESSFQRLQAALGKGDWVFYKSYLNATANPFAQVLLFSRLKSSLVQKIHVFTSTELVDLRMPQARAR